jgi:hypothetical protein
MHSFTIVKRMVCNFGAFICKFHQLVCNSFTIDCNFAHFVNKILSSRILKKRTFSRNEDMVKKTFFFQYKYILARA